jgi:pyruvate dehydrogenase E1 component alpha subunit
MAFPTYREHGVLYCRGIDPIMPLGLFRGVDQGGWDPNAISSTCIRLSSAPRRCTRPATPWAWPWTARSGTDDGEAVIAYFGDGATRRATVNEAFVWASVFNAPSCSSARTTSTRSRSRWSGRPGCRCTAGPPASASRARVDGNDVLACYAVTRKALDNARHGQGPT